MSVRGRGCSKMPCESCAVQFSVFRRKRACTECERYYCAGCLRRGGGAMCAPCRALSTRPLQRPAIAHLKVRDLQCFLQRQNVSTRGCVEKEELVSLCVAHVNSAAYRRRAPRAPFPSLKGFTTNINDFINNTFDLRPQPPAPRAAPPAHPHPHPPAPTGTNRDECYNTVPAHVARHERFTPTPGGQERISVPVPEDSEGGESRAGADAARVDTADCFEVEDMDDSGWEFVRRPAEPLPNDSEVLLSSTEGWAPRTPLRSSSSLELRSGPRAASPAADRVSLQDEPAPAPPAPQPQPACPAPQPQPACPAPRPRPACPAPRPQPACPAPRPRPACPAPQPQPACPAPQPQPACPAPQPQPACPAPRPRPACPAPRPQPACPAPRPRPACPAPQPQPACPAPQPQPACPAPQPQPARPASPAPPTDGNESDTNTNSAGTVTLEGLSQASELEALGVRQLKELLARNRVEFRGCVEREELLVRARQLWREHARYRGQLESLPLEECCKICMAAPLECVLLECGHIAACTRCAKQLSECPICRQYVVRAVRFFRS